MARFWLFLVVLLLIGLVAGGVFLMVWDIPAPSQPVEKVLPGDMFPE